MTKEITQSQKTHVWSFMMKMNHYTWDWCFERVSLGEELLQVRKGMTCPRGTAPNGTVPDNYILRPITFASKSLSSTENITAKHYTREAVAILHRLQKFHHCCFAREVQIIVDRKPLVAISIKTWECYHRDWNASYEDLII